MTKKMGCSGGGPNMYKIGSQERNSPMNFSDKAMMYMKKMPAMYGKPKMMINTAELSESKRKLVEGVAKAEPKMYKNKKK